MDYSKLSDFEINGRVARATQKIGDFTQARGKTLIHDYEDVGDFKNICVGWKEFDPCNNPADAWPIITKSLIELVPNRSGEWRANSVCCYFRQPYQSNPLRAAMIVFLMMQESER